jgi:hypothetical protein
MIDRYPKIVLTVIAAALVVLAVRPIEVPIALAQLPEGPWVVGERKTVKIPKNWGRVVGVTAQDFWFEADDGTIRRESSAACGVCDWVRR